MKTKLTDKILETLRNNPLKGPQLEAELRTLLGVDLTDLDGGSPEEAMASRVAEALVKKLGLQPRQDPEEAEKAVMERLYPSVAHDKPGPQEPDPSPERDMAALLYPTMKEE